MSGTGFDLAVANSLWPHVDETFLPSFLALAKKYYGALITRLDYSRKKQARQTINTWVAKKTRGKVKELLPPGALDETTSLVLTNAVYFKGDWWNSFDEKQTHEAPFFAAPGKIVDATMMAQRQPLVSRSSCRSDGRVIV